MRNSMVRLLLTGAQSHRRSFVRDPHLLEQQGIRDDTCVGLSREPDIDMVLRMFGIPWTSTPHVIPRPLLSRTEGSLPWIYGFEYVTPCEDETQVPHRRVVPALVSTFPHLPAIGCVTHHQE